LPTVVFYISGHGFGHASRDIEVINAMLARRDDLRMIARTTAPAWLFERTVTIPEPHRPHGVPAFRRDPVETDTGVIQIDSLHLDERQTVERARAFMSTFEDRAATEAALLRANDTKLVVADIPALGVAAARHAGVPAVALGNFTWDWIYAAYDDAADIVDGIARAYAAAEVALRLPMHGGFESMARIIDVPLVARRSRRDPDDTRRLLHLPLDRPVVLLSFGGYGLERIDQDALASLRNVTVVGSANHPLDERAMYDAGVRYEDLVRAADIVVSKPGYGIISECIANDTALLYTSRGHFVEYDVLVRELPRYLRAAFIGHDDLFAGRWQSHLDALLTQAPPPERMPVNGADVADELLLDMI
jgi:L-arabinokinase